MDNRTYIQATRTGRTAEVATITLAGGIIAGMNEWVARGERM
jgi:hypothetical protein